MGLGLKRFVRYTVVGVSTFLFDLALLYVAVSMLGVAYYIAIPCAFLVAVSGNYGLSRHFVFKGTTRKVHHGYIYFIVPALGAALVTTALVAELVSQFGMYYLVARIIVAGIVGMGNYLFNLYVNFKVVGRHDML